MTEFSTQIENMRYRAESQQELKRTVKDLEDRYKRKYDLYSDMVQAQKVLATVSDSNTKRVLGYIQGVINRSLSTMFPNDAYNIRIEKKLYNNTNPHINVILTEALPNGETHQLDFSLQSGDGMGQLVSFIFSLCLLKIRGARPIIYLDEVLKGFHPDAIPYVRSVIEIFAKGGFQFVMVEYDLDDLGREYVVKKENGVSELVLLDRENLELDINNDTVEGEISSEQDS